MFVSFRPSQLGERVGSQIYWVEVFNVIVVVVVLGSDVVLQSRLVKLTKRVLVYLVSVQLHPRRVLGYNFFRCCCSWFSVTKREPTQGCFHFRWGKRTHMSVIFLLRLSSMRGTHGVLVCILVLGLNHPCRVCFAWSRSE